MEKGQLKKIDKKGLKFTVKALNEHALIFDDGKSKMVKRQLGIVVTDVVKNQYGIKKGTKMIID